jgi:F-type H+-transporting ATPase subunit epsilon
MSKLNVELVTPEALLFSSDVEMVVVPGVKGYFGVLAGHSPMISSLRPGIVDVYEAGAQISKRIFIADGFAEVNQERCTILARKAVDVTGNDEEASRLVKEAEVK